MNAELEHFRTQLLTARARSHVAVAELIASYASDAARRGDRETAQAACSELVREVDDMETLIEADTPRDSEAAAKLRAQTAVMVASLRRILERLQAFAGKI